MENRFPKNVRQIGNVSDTPKIYVEDYVDTFLNQICDKKDETPVGAFLVGKKVRRDDKECIYISGAIRMETVDQIGPDIGISEETWELAEAERQKYFDDHFIGWCICIPGQPLRLNSNLNKLHNTRFGEDGTVCVIKATTGEEIYYAYKYRELMQIGGHYIYYEKNPAMQDYMIMSRKKIGVTPSEAVEDQAAKDFRNLVKEKMEIQEQRKASRFMYAASVFLVLVVMVMGVVTMNNYDKMRAVQSSVESIKASVEGNEGTQLVVNDTLTGEVTETDTVDAENAESTETTQEVSQTETDVGSETTEENKEQEVVSTMQEMSEDIYVVKKGDTLAKISKNIYGDISHVDAICRMNGLTDGNLIFIGQKLLLP